MHTWSSTPTTAACGQLPSRASSWSRTAACEWAACARKRASSISPRPSKPKSSWLVYDLDSTNGTFVDGQRVSPTQPRVLGLKGQLRLGDHDLDVVQDVVRNDSDSAGPPAAQAKEG